jgi:hypothetical protein
MKVHEREQKRDTPAERLTEYEDGARIELDVVVIYENAF